MPLIFVLQNHLEGLAKDPAINIISTTHILKWIIPLLWYTADVKAYKEFKKSSTILNLLLMRNCSTKSFRKIQM